MYKFFVYGNIYIIAENMFLNPELFVCQVQ